MDLDDYDTLVNKKGDEGSELLAKIFAPTLRNNGFVEVVQEGMNGVAGLRIPRGHVGVVHSSMGDPGEMNAAAYAASVITRLVQQAKALGAKPVGLADEINTQTGDTGLLRVVADAMVERANHHKLAILNGENALLGSRVTTDANIVGTMISILREDALPSDRDGVYTFFDPQGRLAWINSDGQGTKAEFHERAKRYHLALEDSVAMKLDDTIKRGAQPVVVSDIVEIHGTLSFSQFSSYAHQLSLELGIPYMVQGELHSSRIAGYRPGLSAFNVGGSVVSLIDEERLKNPLHPSEGEYLVAVKGRPNPRSNGITDLRKIMIAWLGENWHQTGEGKKYLKFLSAPSTILYPAFRELVDERLATSVYHLSGGAYNGKLAKPLAKAGLFAPIHDLFPPAEEARVLAEKLGGTTASWYAKWPMGTDGFVTTNDVHETISRLRKHGLEGRVVARLQTAREKSGVELTAYNGEKVYFSGRK